MSPLLSSWVLQTEKKWVEARHRPGGIPVKFELPGDDAILRREGDRLVIEPPPKRRLLDLLATWKPLDDEFPEIPDEAVKPEDVF
jgi:antitoxin VapB